MYNDLLIDAKSLLESLVDRTIDENQFRNEYSEVYMTLKECLPDGPRDRPYYPLNDLLEMSGDQLLKFAAMAIPRIPREILARQTQEWVYEKLTDGGDYFLLDKANLEKLFVSSKKLYFTEIANSILLSAMNGKISTPFDYGALLKKIKTLAGSEPAAWVQCSEPDNAFANIERPWTLGNDIYLEHGHLSKLERIDPGSVQGGNCYCLLVPESKSWLLLHTYLFSSLEIAIYGEPAFVGEF